MSNFTKIECLNISQKNELREIKQLQQAVIDLTIENEIL